MSNAGSKGYPYVATRCMNKDQASVSPLPKTSKWERKGLHNPRKLKNKRNKSK